MSLPSPLTEPLLYAFVLPNGFRDSNTLKLSLVLELNTTHRVFTIDLTATDANTIAAYDMARTEWLEQMSKFYQTLNAYAQTEHLNVKVEGISDLLKPVVPTTFDGGSVLPHDRSSWPNSKKAFDGCPIRTPEARQLFEKCVFSPADPKDKRAPSHTSEPLVKLSPPPGLNARTAEPKSYVRPLSAEQQQQQQQQAPSDFILDVFRGIVQDQTLNLTQVPLAKQADIYEVANYIDRLNAQRNKVAHDAYFAAYLKNAVVTATVADLALETNPATKLSGLAEYVYTKTKALHEATADEPTGVLAAYDLLGSSFGFRRWLGTILDLEVTLPDNFSAGHYTVTVELVGGAGLDVLAPDEFCQVIPSRFDIGPAANPRWVSLAHNSTHLHKGVVDLSHISRIEQAEVEARLRNADQALATATGQVAQLLQQPLLKPKELAPTLHFSVTALVGDDSRQQLLAYYHKWAIVRQGVKHINNLRTKGHALYLLKHPDPPTPAPSGAESPTPPLTGEAVQAADLVAGYVIYSQQSGTSGWQSLCTVHEELHHPATGRTICTWSEPIGVALGNGVLVHDETRQDDNAALQTLADLFLFVYDGTNLATRHPLRHYDGPLTPPAPPPAIAANKARLQAASLEVARLQAHQQAVDTTQAEITAVRLKTAREFGIDDFPFSTAKGRPHLLLRRQPQEVHDNKPSTAKLLFAGQGRDNQYRYLALTQYRNGYVPGQQQLALNTNAAILQGYASPPTKFFRQEHIGDVVVSLKEPIYEADGRRTLRKHAGESTRQLVVRTGQLLDNDTCERYLLPPISPGFQTLPWSDPDWLHRLGPDAYRWFLRSQCQVESEVAFTANLAVSNERRQLGNKELADTGCPAACPGYCGHTRQPDVYDGRLHYLPDPAVTGLHVAFFLDEACLTPADPLEYAPLTLRWPNARHRYPDLQPWRLVLRKDEHPDQVRQGKITIYDWCNLLEVQLRPGNQLFTLVTATYNHADSPFDPMQPLAKSPTASRQWLQAALQRRHAPALSATEEEEYHVNHLLANSVCLTLTHATQTPLLAPVLQPASVRLVRSYVQAADSTQPTSRAAGAFMVEARVQFEHLNVPQGCYLADMPPTGELELFALWNDFTDTSAQPSPSIGQKRAPNSPTGGFLRVATRTFLKQGSELPTLLNDTDGDHQRRCEQLIQFESDPSVQVLHHTDMVLRVRNVSRFQQYFVRDSEREQPARAPHSLAEQRQLELQKEPFSLWSAEYRLADYYKEAPVGHLTPLAEFRANYLPNNAKPQSPRIHKIVPLLVQDDALDATRRTWQSSRMRLYLRPDHLMQPGEKSRVAIPVYTPGGAYPTYLHPWLARGGTDAVTDAPTAQAWLATTSTPFGDSYLAASNFCIDAKQLESDYLTRFEPLLDDGPSGSALGVVSYLPQFDAGQQLWYVDVQLMLRNQANTEPHNAFVQLGLASHQPLSANYNAPAAPSIDSATGFAQDMRLSVPTLVDFFSVLPSRQFGNPYILFLDNQAEHFSLACQLASLFVREHHGRRTLATQFLLVVEQRTVGDVWKLVPSALTSHEVRVDNHPLVLHALYPSRFYHPLLPPDLLQQVPAAPIQALIECTANLDIQTQRGWFLHRSHLRVAVYEVDWHDAQAAGLATLNTQLAHLEQAIRPSDMPLASPTQIPGVLVRNCTVFWERSKDEM